MFPRSVLLALVAGLAAFAVGHDESTATICTSTETVSITTPIAARSTSIPPALPQTVSESVPSVPTPTNPLDIIFTASGFSSAISALASSFPTGHDFGTVTAPSTTYSFSFTPITNPSDLSTPASKSTIFLGPNTTLTPSAKNTTSTSTSSSSTSTTKTSTSSAATTTTNAAATTSPATQPGSGAMGMPVGKSANLALVGVAGVMLFL